MLDLSYRADFICFSVIIVELKAIRAICGVEEAQLLNYMKAKGCRRGLLLNFGTPRLELKRMVLNWQHCSICRCICAISKQHAFICVIGAICGSS